VGKHPRVSGGFKAATLDEDQTRAWWTKWPTANLGMPTGVTSGMVVIDVDPRHGGNESLRVLQAQYGDLPPTRTHQTDGGGTHYLYRYPGSQRPIACRARILASAPGVDVRGDGGYIIVPPSRGALMRYAILDPREPVSLPEPGSCSCAVARRDPPFPLAEPGPGRSSRAAAT
jgi:hypothetical protein